MAAVLIQADDFSGAAEVGQCFAAQGLDTRLLLSPADGGTEYAPDVLVVDTHSRAVAPDVAAAASAAVFSSAAADGAAILFKKIDSLWRGNVGPELTALSALGHHAVVAGALPQLNRTVVGGRPFADGVRLDGTDLWRAESAAPPAEIAQLLGPGPAVQLAGLSTVRSGGLPGFLSDVLSRGAPATVIVDGETPADLEAVADALLDLDFRAGGRRIVLAGTGGMALLLAEKLDSSSARNAQKRGSRGITAADGPRTVLAAVGSASAKAAAQLRNLEAGGFTALRIAPDELQHPQDFHSRLREAQQLLAAGGPAALTVGAAVVNPDESGTIVRNLARLAAGAATGPQAAGPASASDLILTGGETAREVLDALGIRSLTPLASVQHGAVVSLSDDGRLVGTKPGSFGDSDALVQLYSAIKDLRSSNSISHPFHTPGAPMTSAVNATDQDARPFIAVTMGDGSGVGPEVTVGALLDQNAYRDCRPVVIGDVHRLQLGAKALGVEANIVEVETVGDAVFDAGRINVIDPKLLSADLPWGQVSAEAGNAAYHYIRIACELGMGGQVQGICTAPLNKAALHKAGHIYPGHTELLAHFMGVEEVSMMLSTPKVKVIHVTTHIGLIDAINKIEPGLVERTVRRGHGAMQRAGIATPKIGVCAINPHAGENGLFGYGEEAEKITPAIEKLQADGIDARGPLPADTAFFLAGRGDYDLIVAMYHDQGHGPIKVLGIEAGVNITVGLPVIRTSVDHGTAFDIAGKGIVDVRSMIEALRQAAEMSPSPAAA
ncbi:4-hydroxythreonine-4-phosphate dehydrogenase PdxA [Arthrobacter sp. FW305-BF8]|uniref:4-hydroxythreonine-4-phosphate dehydrogenase PdxA n=1 Tax=Arthrobacter sp. FW305-BF8 TaxID=2879617 RepID=UPI001F02C6CA|nr:4-hydroxythreonine-4-phosphate dehydrogenase PdxA [Arthrobacter sp. FW305-BF8]UKA54550.1 4-hydroxythreonine-4-phosphate dehydrogenase PdxA [Arthrobacter sp. FW305-BF8]